MKKRILFFIVFLFLITACTTKDNEITDSMTSQQNYAEELKGYWYNPSNDSYVYIENFNSQKLKFVQSFDYFEDISYLEFELSYLDSSEAYQLILSDLHPPLILSKKTESHYAENIYYYAGETESSFLDFKDARLNSQFVLQQDWFTGFWFSRYSTNYWHIEIIDEHLTISNNNQDILDVDIHKDIDGNFFFTMDSTDYALIRNDSMDYSELVDVPNNRTHNLYYGGDSYEEMLTTRFSPPKTLTPTEIDIAKELEGFYYLKDFSSYVSLTLNENYLELNRHTPNGDHNKYQFYSIEENYDDAYTLRAIDEDGVAYYEDIHKWDNGISIYTSPLYLYGGNSYEEMLDSYNSQLVVLNETEIIDRLLGAWWYHDAGYIEYFSLNEQGQLFVMSNLFESCSVISGLVKNIEIIDEDTVRLTIEYNTIYEYIEISVDVSIIDDTHIELNQAIYEIFIGGEIDRDVPTPLPLTLDNETWDFSQ